MPPSHRSLRRRPISEKPRDARVRAGGRSHAAITSFAAATPDLTHFASPWRHLFRSCWLRRGKLGTTPHNKKKWPTLNENKLEKRLKIRAFGLERLFLKS